MATEKKLLKITLIGDTKVGKRGIMQKAVGASLSEQITYADVLIKEETAYGKMLQIWDGSEENISGSDAFVFVVDSTKPLTEISKDHIKTLLEAAKSEAPEAKFYIVINKWDRPPHEDFSNQETAKNSLKQFVMAITEKNLADDAVFFLAQDENVENIDTVFNKIEKDYISEYEPHLLEQKSSESLAKKTSTPDQPTPLPTRSKVWIGGNLLLAAGGAILLGLSIATGGIFPGVIIGLSIALSVGLIAWNVGCKIYDNYSKKQKQELEPSMFREEEPEDNSDEYRDTSDIESSFGYSNPKQPTDPNVQSSSIYNTPPTDESTKSPTKIKSEKNHNPPSGTTPI